MQVIQFNLQGKMAHFRKYYSNSTALSYYVPPVTTIKGILAGVLGMERDSYYKLFSNQQCQIAISVQSRIKKITQTMNLLNVDGINDLCGAGRNRTQNDTEWIVPENIRTGIISYGVVVKHNDVKVIEKLQEVICTNMDNYYSEGISVALGAAQCLGWISGGQVLQAEPYLACAPIETAFAIPIDKLKDIDMSTSSCSLRKEETITEFDEKRFITQDSKQDILLSGDGRKIVVNLKPDTQYWIVNGENMLFLGEK